MSSRRKSRDPLLNPADNPGDQSATTPPASAILAKMEADKSRHMSLSTIASLLGKDRATVTKWVKTEGCPSVQKADKSLGQDWIIDISEVVRWLQERAAADAVQKFGLSEDGQVTEAEAKRRSAVAKAIVNMVEAAEVMKAVIPTDYVRERLSRECADVVAAVSVIPDMIAGKVDPAIAVRARKIADEQVRTALEKLKFADEISASPSPEE